MARIRKPQPTLDNLFFQTPDQKVARFLLTEPTTAFTPRVISSKLKGVRGLGGIDGIVKVLTQLEEIGMVEFIDHRRSVRLNDDQPVIEHLKIFSAICDLEGLKPLMEPISQKAVLFGSRSTGKFRSDSDYDIFIVSRQPEEVRHVGERHPLGKRLELVIWTPEDYDAIETKDPTLAAKLAKGFPLWGPRW